MSKIIVSLRAFLTLAILLGIIYPLFITGLSKIIMPQKANGSLIIKNKEIIGSKLIGQSFDDPKYFHSRFSASNYDAKKSTASNLAPSNKKLLEQVATRIKQIKTENNLKKDIDLPADMVLTSASGVDPHISISNAMLQLPRVAKIRKIPSNKIESLIKQNTDPDFIGIWGHEGVNVLKLNLALDELKK